MFNVQLHTFSSFSLLYTVRTKLNLAKSIDTTSLMTLNFHHEL